MIIHKILRSISMQIKILLRNHLTVGLLIIIPLVFLGVVYLTSSTREIAFKLGSLSDDRSIAVPELSLNIIFMAVALAGFLVSFYALVLVQKNRETYRRLLVCGFGLPALLISFFITQALLTAGIAGYLTGIISLFLDPKHWVGVFWGLFLIGIVYASYASLVGSIVKGQLEGIFLIVLLANIDAGWLQNPIFYAGAENQIIIRYLPAFYPSQATLIKAFTDFESLKPIVYSLAYAFGLMVLSILAYFFKFTPQRTRD